ncbi:MAG: DUF6430 domain-containing protein [Oscillospiraceae bacterium]|jgi:hypothetical protein|nr:DUF6430 domain-containing protein [Oscillospiraceae bacterium]
MAKKIRLIWGRLPKLHKDSLAVAFAVFAFMLSLVDILGNPLREVKWHFRLLAIVAFLVLIYIIVAVIKERNAQNGLSLTINRNAVKIEVRDIKDGGIFKFHGWKLISFNEYFDTTVDDVIINHNSINGKFIDDYVEDINDLNTVLNNTPRKAHKLGTIVPYKNEYMCLSFSKFDTKNQAFFNGRGEYEQCLREMWAEIRRVYANKPVAIPLLGSSIPIFRNTTRPTKYECLKCILCTLKSSNVYFDKAVTVIIDKESAQEINLYELKGAL